MDDLLSDFIAETREGLEALDSELVRFEQQPDDPETLGGIFRLVHTIKGTCGFLGLSRLQTVAHAAENVLGGFRDGVVPVTPEAVSAILETVDTIRGITDGIAATGVEPTGDDTALISRLEAVLEGGAASEGQPGSTAPAAAPAAPTADSRPLIEQLGGDATLDVAAEMVLGPLKQAAQFAGAFADAQTDNLQAAVRDSLCALARKQQPAPTFTDALTAVASAPLKAGDAAAVFQLVSEALADLGVSASAADRLRGLALPAPSAVPEPAQAIPPATPPVAAAKPAPDAKPAKEPVPPPAAPAQTGATSAAEAAGSQTIRVSVDTLEQLMTVVSELVLIRNQLIQTLRLEPESPFAAPLNRLNQVTTELQERVMTTRMQPISGAWAKLPRLVRDLTQDLGKQIDLVMLGQETELDRQVLEMIKDPLTHMIRNAADHGLEGPEERLAAGKAETGRITLQARHEGGAIIIEVSDDGRGLCAEKIRAKAAACGLITPMQAEQMSDADARQLIFLPGFSTASQVTAVSGRGVGMDVVRTNIEKIGGVIEVSSQEGRGSRFTIRIPLTLTIVSALIVESGGERFAIPQSAVLELVSASGGSGRTIEHINGAAVLRLRDRLLPLISLQALLGLEAPEEPSLEACIVVARVGSFTFGVMVDRVFDTEEIVVKPVATILRHLRFYSGATILGDGAVILILDPKGISVEAGAAQSGAGLHAEADAEDAEKAENLSEVLVFRAGGQTLKAAPLSNVSRLEEVAAAQIEQVDGRSVIQYRDKLMPVAGVDGRPVTAWAGGSRRPLLVFSRGDASIGLVADEIVDILEAAIGAHQPSGERPNAGSLIIEGRAAELIDVGYYWRVLTGGGGALQVSQPSAFGFAGEAGVPALHQRLKRLLIVDQSPFSQLLLRPLLAQAGYEVTVVADPKAALALHDTGDQFHLIMADTSRGGAHVQEFAATFGRANRWHTTPLLGVAMHKGGGNRPEFDTSTLLDAVSNAVDGLRGAA